MGTVAYEYVVRISQHVFVLAGKGRGDIFTSVERSDRYNSVWALYKERRNRCRRKFVGSSP